MRVKRNIAAAIVAVPVSVGAMFLGAAVWVPFIHQLNVTNAAKRELPVTERSGRPVQLWSECRGENFAAALPSSVFRRAVRPLPSDIASATSKARAACPFPVVGPR